MSTSLVTPMLDPTPVLSKIRPFLAPGPRSRRRRVVAAMTEIRSGGVGTPTLPVVATRSSASFDLVGDAVATALESVAVLDAHSRELADAFRWHQIADATHGLANLVRGIRTLLTLAALTTSAAGTAVEAECAPEREVAQDDMQAALDQLLSQQIARDWTGLADTLDEALPAALAQWRVVFELLGGCPIDPQGLAA